MTDRRKPDAEPVLAAVRFTANFEGNLQQVSAFWAEQGAPQVYLQLLDALDKTVIGNLERHPRIGRNFFARTAHSIEVRSRVETLSQRFGEAQVREYLFGDYLVLYCVVPQRPRGKSELTVYLLAIRHHRQLSFDFDGFWQAGTMVT